MHESQIPGATTTVSKEITFDALTAICMTAEIFFSVQQSIEHFSSLVHPRSSRFKIYLHTVFSNTNPPIKKTKITIFDLRLLMSSHLPLLH